MPLAATPSGPPPVSRVTLVAPATSHRSTTGVPASTAMAVASSIVPSPIVNRVMSGVSGTWLSPSTGVNVNRASGVG